MSYAAPKSKKLMQQQTQRRYTVEDYFAIEESSTTKHEYFGGEIFAMAGASLAHNRLTGNAYAALRAKSAGSAYEVFASDLRIRTPGGLYTYPDVMVICGGVELSEEDRLDTAINPTLIVEVLSESTKAYDRGDKFKLYREVPGLRDYVPIEQSTPFVEHYSCDTATNRWHRRRYAALNDTLELSSLGIKLTLAEIYARVAFEDAG